MKRLTTGLVVTALLAVGCGSGSNSGDGGYADADLRLVDGASRDGAAPGSAPDFSDCLFDTDCENPDSDCVPIADLVGNPKQCLPRCTELSQCSYATYCYPQGLPSQYGLMSGHCWLSLCGEQFGVSSTSGPCKLGEGIGASTADQVDGYCLPLDDGRIGICLETGFATAGEACDFDPTHGGANCTVQTICIGFEGNPVGTCEPLCDPRLILLGQDTGCGVSAGCRDISRVQAGQNQIFEQTIGYCADGLEECSLLGNSNCPLSALNNPQSCESNNPLRPTGQCAELAYGTLTGGSQCVQPTTNTPASQRCATGTWCFGPDTNTLSCETVCDVANPSVIDCGGLTCLPVLWSLGPDQLPDTIDDIETLDWGTCQ